MVFVYIFFFVLVVLVVDVDVVGDGGWLAGLRKSAPQLAQR